MATGETTAGTQLAGERLVLLPLRLRESGGAERLEEEMSVVLRGT